MSDPIQTSQGPIQTLALQLPVWLPGEDRNWHEFVGMAQITQTGEIFIKFADNRANTKLIDMALDKLLFGVSFDYKLSEQQAKELNERYTKKIVSRVGLHPIMLDGEDVGTAEILSDGTIKITTANDEQTYVIDTNKKKETT